MNMREKILRTMRENERFILSRVRRANRVGALFNFWYGHGMGRNDRALNNAMDRLLKAGKVVVLPRRGRRGYGYRLAAARAPQRGWQVVDHQGRLPGEQYYAG